MAGFEVGRHGRRNTCRTSIIERNTPFIARCIEAAYGHAKSRGGGQRAAERIAPDENQAKYLLERNQAQLALLEAKACRPRLPACGQCPVRNVCTTWRRRQARNPPKGAPTVAEIFCGAGGMSLGFERAGFHPVLAVDIDVDALNTYIANRPHLPDSTAVVADAAELVRDSEIMATLRSVDGIIGGPPCQTFSMVGMRTKNWEDRQHRMEGDPRTWLPVRMAEIIAKARPMFSVMENVAGFQSALGGRVRLKVQEVLRDAGYVFGEAKVWAHYHGTPQKRWRYILVALRPYGNGGRTKAQEQVNAIIEKLSSATTQQMSFNDALSEQLKGLGRVGPGEGGEYVRRGRAETWNHYARPHNARDLEIYKAMRPGERAVDLEERRPNMIPYELESFKDKYRKLHPDEPSPTVPAHLKRDANSFIHPREHRGITPREAAILQGFPRNYVFIGEQSHQFQQIGNAVPPPVAETVAGLIPKTRRPRR